MQGLTRLKIEGFKSIRSAELELRPLNVLIGANGSGKSNLVSFFRLLGAIGEGRLRETVSEWGGRDALLHFGAKVTPELSCIAEALTNSGTPVEYAVILTPSRPDALVFHAERTRLGDAAAPTWVDTYGPGHPETRYSASWGDAPPPEAVDAFLTVTSARCYHFNDTTPQARLMRQGYIHDNRQLESDAGNLAAYLYMLREAQEPYYRRIVDTIRMVAPFFGDFVIEPLELNPNNVMLNWRDRAREYLFGPHQLSDGTLRFIALATLLLQPEERLPKLIVIDEPELGLHPFALSVLAGLLRSVSQDVQVVVATQSAFLVDEFEPEDIVVVDHREGESTFQRLSTPELASWLERYSLAELWLKNFVGGRPSR